MANRETRLSDALASQTVNNVRLSEGPELKHRYTPLGAVRAWPSRPPLSVEQSWGRWAALGGTGRGSKYSAKSSHVAVDEPCCIP